MDNNAILLMFNLVMLVINLWMQHRTLEFQDQIIKRDQDFIQETARIINSRIEEKKSEEWHQCR